MKHRLSIEFDTDAPTLGHLENAASALLTRGAPREAQFGLMMGDKGSQRDPWPYLRGLTVEWDE